MWTKTMAAVKVLTVFKKKHRSKMEQVLTLSQTALLPPRSDSTSQKGRHSKVLTVIKKKHRSKMAQVLTLSQTALLPP
jgi:hypothetical protein